MEHWSSPWQGREWHREKGSRNICNWSEQGSTAWKQVLYCWTLSVLLCMRLVYLSVTKLPSWHFISMGGTGHWSVWESMWSSSIQHWNWTCTFHGHLQGSPNCFSGQVCHVHCVWLLYPLEKGTLSHLLFTAPLPGSQVTLWCTACFSSFLHVVSS